MQHIAKSSIPSAYVLSQNGDSILLDVPVGYAYLDGASSDQPLLNSVTGLEAHILSAPRPDSLQFELQSDAKTAVIGQVPKKSSNDQLKHIIAKAENGQIVLKQAVAGAKLDPISICGSLLHGDLKAYVLAGDAKDLQAVEKLLSGSHQDDALEKLFSLHSLVTLLVWQPSHSHQPIKRVLHAGTASFARLASALERCKTLSILNASTVTPASGQISAPSRPAPPKAPPSAPTNRRSSGSAPTRGPPRPASGPAAVTKQLLNKMAPVSRPAVKVTTTSTTAAAPAKRPPSGSHPTSSSTRPAPGGGSTIATAQRNAKSTAPARETIKKTTIQPVGGARMSKPPSAPEPRKGRNTAPTKPSAPKQPTPSNSKAAAIKPTNDQKADKPNATAGNVSVPVGVGEGIDNLLPNPVQLIVIPPTPEPPKDEPNEVKSPVPHNEPSIPNEPELDNTQHQHPIVPSAPTVPGESQTHGDDEKPHPEPSAPLPPVPSGPAPAPADPLINFDPTPVQPPQPPAQNDDVPDAFKAPFVPQPPGESGLLDDVEEPMRVRKISMDTDKAEELLADIDTGSNQEHRQVKEDYDDLYFAQSPSNGGNSTVVENPAQQDIAQPALEAAKEMMQSVGSGAIEEAARKLSEKMAADGTTSVVTAFASTLIEEHIPLNHHNNGSVANGDVMKQETSSGDHHDEHEVSKTTVMQTRASIVSEDGEPVKVEIDPVLDGVLDMVAAQSEVLDANQDEKPVLHLQPTKASAAVRLSRPFYFDLVTLPHNAQGLCSLGDVEALEFFTMIRSTHYIVHTKDIAENVLNAAVDGKKTWPDKNKTIHIYPTLGTPNVASFRAKLAADGVTDIDLRPAIDHSTLSIGPADGPKTELKAVKFEL